MANRLKNALGGLALMAAAHDQRTTEEKNDAAKWAAMGYKPVEKTPSRLEAGLGKLKDMLTQQPKVDPVQPQPATTPAAAPAAAPETMAGDPTTQPTPDNSRTFTTAEWRNAPGSPVDKEPMASPNMQGPEQFDVA